MLSGYPLKDSKIKNYQHTMYSHPEIRDYHMDNLNIFEYIDETAQFVAAASKSIQYYAEHLYDEDVVKELFERRHEFDLFLVDKFANEVRYLGYTESVKIN